MYRVFIVRRRGGQFQVEMSQNVIATVNQMNNRLKKLGKKPWDYWKLVWFGKADDMYSTRKQMSKILQKGGYSAMIHYVKKLQDEDEDSGLEIQAEFVDEL